MLLLLYDYYIVICLVIVSPTNVNAAVLTPRSVKVTWDQYLFSDVTGYLILYTTNASYTGGGSVTVDGSDNTSYTLANLEEDTLYTITVQATTNDNRISPYSIALTVITYTDG